MKKPMPTGKSNVEIINPLRFGTSYPLFHYETHKETRECSPR